MTDKNSNDAQAPADEATLAQTVVDNSAEPSASAESAFTPSDLVAPAVEAATTTPPEPVAAPVAPPQPITVEVDEATKALLTQQFVSLSSTVLDAADVASQAAKAANEAGQKFNHSSARLTQISKGMGKTSTIVLGSTAVLMLISIGFFAAMGVRLISKVNQLDATTVSIKARPLDKTQERPA
jgi:hypothetical protein